jgi:hypothetical protein
MLNGRGFVNFVGENASIACCSRNMRKITKKAHSSVAVESMVLFICTINIVILFGMGNLVLKHCRCNIFMPLVLKNVSMFIMTSNEFREICCLYYDGQV